MWKCVTRTPLALIKPFAPEQQHNLSVRKRAKAVLVHQGEVGLWYQTPLRDNISG